MMIRGKKGDATDPLVVVILLFFFAITFVVSIFVNNQIKNVIQTTELNSTSVAPAIISSLEDISTITVQRAYMMLFAFLIIGVIATSFLSRTYPVFMFIYILFLIPTIFVAVILQNAYESIVSNPIFEDIISINTAFGFVMSNIMKIALAVGAITMIVTFSKFVVAPSSGGTEDIG